MVPSRAVPSPRINVGVMAFSCQQHLPEQVASIHSFLRNVGTPDSYTVVSDGTYEQDAVEVLESLDPSVHVVHWRDRARALPDALARYADVDPMGRKLAALVSISDSGPTIYADSDVLFLPGAGRYLRELVSAGVTAWYLPDCFTSLDRALLRGEGEAARPVNAGFMVFLERLNWDFGLARLEESGIPPRLHTEQTVVHLTMHRNGAQPLDGQRFVLSVADELTFSDSFAGRGIALRHYVGRVRHKLWQRVWRDQCLPTLFPSYRTHGRSRSSTRL